MNTRILYILLPIFFLPIQMLGQTKNKPESVKAYDKLFITYYETDNTLKLNTDLKALSTIFKFENRHDTYLMYAYLYRLSSFLRLEDLNSASKLINPLTTHIEEYDNGCHYQLVADVYFLNSSYYFKIGEINKAKEFLDKFFHYNNIAGVTVFHRRQFLVQQAKIQVKYGEYQDALVNLETCLKISDHYSKKEEYLWVYTDILRLHLEQRNFDEIEKYYKKASQIFNNLDYNLKTKKYIENFQLFNIKYHLEKGIFNEYLLEEFPIKEDCLSLLKQIKLNILKGRYYYSKNELAKSNELFTNTESLILEQNVYNKLDLFELYFYKSKTLEKLGSIDKSKALLYQAIALLNPKFFVNKNMETDTPYLKQIMKALLYLNELDTHSYDKYKRNTARILNESMRMINQEYDLLDDNSQVIDIISNLQNNAITLALKNKDSEFSSFISRIGKAQNLIKSINYKRKQDKLNYSKDDIKKLHAIKNDSKKVKELFPIVDDYLRAYPDDTDLIFQVNSSKLDSLLRLTETLTNEYESIHNNYYKLLSDDIDNLQNYDYKSDQIRNKLTSNQALIEYHLTSDKIYTFSYTASELNIYETSFDESLSINIDIVNQHIRSLYSDISFKNFTIASSQLYQTLLHSVLAELDKNITQLYIVPDKVLNYVPFEVLLPETGETIPKGRYDFLPYIGRKYDISYHYSSTLLNQKNNSLSNTLCGFAPSFSSTYSSSENLDELFHNQNEVLLIKNITDGKMHIDSTASVTTLRKSFDEYTIAHLATHASCNDTLPFDSKIYMEDGPLFAHEIYNMPHNLDLAVLSACKTGDGELRKGEGIMSLARAFISSGCKSVVTSLWNVNDRNSSLLMQYFYKHLWSGKSISNSLAQSKRDYLNNVNSTLQAHPYHWATFIAIGNGDLAIYRPPYEAVLFASILVMLMSISLLRIFS